MTTADQVLVAITGSNGTIGYAALLHALRSNYRVRAIVRRPSAISTIKSGPSAQPYLHRIEYAIVPDNTVLGAYDDALAGVKYVVHIAGAWPLPHLHPDSDIYWPFIKSTKELVTAAQKSGTVKRMVFTQAGAGLVDSEDGDTLGNEMKKVLDENVDVSQSSLTYRPPLKSPHNAYTSAKAQCMTYLSSLSALPFSIAQIIPGTVIGPSEFCTTSAQAFAHMDRQTRALLFADNHPRYAFGFVHVDDCARIHIEALNEDKVGKEMPRWYVAAATVEEGVTGEELWASAADMVEREFATEVEAGLFKVGRSKVPINIPFRADSRLTEKLLLGGEEIRGLEQCVEEVARWYVDLKRREAVSSGLQ
ncbi:3-beta hydroxysteroid dehydrogenase/isomerase family protein [Decorospora gaudefroyi]|uniref:3-beta hydroxysteroid dehydrogenase/isomerase family protein n=1 Tax=Decorospora gaudefroyi TaxID=184978 RepID=A0A6A5KH45_9PLEO|nr:3-beta hydroxysteroid dehydrogenase/isomerase family protein [Decorospora gaudefroyi]